MSTESPNAPDPGDVPASDPEPEESPESPNAPEPSSDTTIVIGLPNPSPIALRF